MGTEADHQGMYPSDGAVNKLKIRAMEESSSWFSGLDILLFLSMGTQTMQGLNLGFPSRKAGAA